MSDNVLSTYVDYSGAARALAALHPDPQMCDPRPVRKWSDRGYMLGIPQLPRPRYAGVVYNY